MREPGELVVAQYFSRGAVETSHGSHRPRTTTLDAEEMALLLRDARCLSKSWHSNIARIRHVDLAGPVLTIASDMVDGTTLDDLLTAARADRIDEREPLLPFPILVRVLVDVLTGVHALHGLRDGLNTAVGAIHGELCPTNVVIGKDGVTRLVDVLRSRPVHVPEGSPAAGYAAPEALAPLGTEDPRADVYSVGAILWEGLTGRSRRSLRGAERATPVMHKSSPFARLAHVAMRALAIDPAVRFASAAEMAAELRKIAGTRLATGTAVAARNFELAGDRMRMRKAILDPATSGMRRRTSERTIAAAIVARDARARRDDVPDDAADTAPNAILTDVAADAYEFEDDDDLLPGPRESSPDVEMEVAMELALAENAMRQRLLTLAPEPSPLPPRSVRPPPPLEQATAGETPGDFVIPIHVTLSPEEHDAPTHVRHRNIAPKHRNAALAVVALLMAMLAAGSFFVMRAQLDASHDGEPQGTTATQPASSPPAADDITTSLPPSLTPPQTAPSARANANASAPRPAPRAPAAPAPAAPAAPKPKKSIYDPEAL